MGIKNYGCEGRVVATTMNYQMTDEQVMQEIRNETDREALAVFRSEEATVIVSMLYPLANVETGERKTLEGLPTGFGWPM